MTNILRSLAAAAMLAAALPALGQTLLVDLPTTTIPLVSTLDNPCTAQTEAIAFKGSTSLSARVWLLPTGNLRMQFAENTALQGQDGIGTLLAPAATYSVTASGEQDIEMDPVAFEVLQFKKVNGTSDLFHSVLVVAFDPGNAKLDVRLEAACDNGMP